MDIPERGGAEPVRLQKLLAAAGVASRRRAEGLIRQGRVAVEGRVVVELGLKVPPNASITVDGRPIGPAETHVYLLLHKPPGYVSTVRDPQRRPTVLELVPVTQRVYPVGRLDYDSEGLMLLTNDGALAHQLLHPRYELEREYHVLVRDAVTPQVVRRLSAGVDVDGRPTAPARVAVLRVEPAGTWLRFVIHEGRKRQVRRMCEAAGLSVLRLIRVRMGPLRLGSLPPGKYRSLRPEEIRSLQALRDSAERAPRQPPR